MSKPIKKGGHSQESDQNRNAELNKCFIPTPPPPTSRSETFNRNKSKGGKK